VRPPKKGAGQSGKNHCPRRYAHFVSGHYPIYGTQMLYFFDRILRSRAEVRRPQSFIPFTTEGFRPRTTPGLRTSPEATSGARPNRRLPASSAVALAQTHQSTKTAPPPGSASSAIPRVV